MAYVVIIPGYSMGPVTNVTIAQGYKGQMLHTCTPLKPFDCVLWEGWVYGFVFGGTGREPRPWDGVLVVLFAVTHAYPAEACVYAVLV